MLALGRVCSGMFPIKPVFDPEGVTPSPLHFSTGMWDCWPDRWSPNCALVLQIHGAGLGAEVAYIMPDNIMPRTQCAGYRHGVWLQGYEWD